MTRITHRMLLVVVVVVGTAATLAMLAMWPGPRDVPQASSAQTTEIADATLLAVEEVAHADNTGLTPGAVTVEVTARLDDTGEEVTFETTTGDLYQPGQKVRLSTITQEGIGVTYFITDFRRGAPLVVLAALFVAAVLWFGRLQGIRALIGLVFTFLLIVLFMIPALLEGRSPLLVAVVGALLIMLITLYLSHGFTAKTTAAVVGTSLTLLVTGALAVLFVEVANITGFSSEEARLANVHLGGISLRGLLLAGIVIGGLGVLDDVTMAQSSTVFQLRKANPAAGFGELTRGALAVGRYHIAATVKTLFLAYAGASLPLLILFAGGPDGLTAVVTSEAVATEIIRTLVGSIGLIAAVPFTTALAAGLVLGEPSSSQAQRRGRRSRVEKQDDEQQDQPSMWNSAHSDPDDDAAWERRVREAYRIPPEEEQ